MAKWHHWHSQAPPKILGETGRPKDKYVGGSNTFKTSYI